MATKVYTIKDLAELRGFTTIVATELRGAASRVKDLVATLAEHTATLAEARGDLVKFGIGGKPIKDIDTAVEAARSDARALLRASALLEGQSKLWDTVDADIKTLLDGGNQQ